MEPGDNPIGSLWDSAVRLRCPACGRGRIFEQLFTMRSACSECGQPLAMGEGDFVGGIYINYGIVALLCIGLFFWMEAKGGYSTSQEVTVLMAVAILVPIISARHTRAFFLATMYSAGGLPKRRIEPVEDGAR